MSEVASKFPLLTIHAMLGVPSERSNEINAIAVGLLLVKVRPGLGLACGQRLGEIVQELMEARVDGVRDDLISQLMVEARNADPSVTDQEVINFLRLLLNAGRGDDDQGDRSDTRGPLDASLGACQGA